MPLTSQPFLLRTTPEGRRLVSWRMWVLVWVTPGVFALAALWLAAEAGWTRLTFVPGEGEVVRVHARDGRTLFDRGRVNHAPVFRYVWSDGQATDASVGMSHPDWSFAVGSRHAILYNPRRKADVVLPGPHNWAVAGVLAALAALPALWASRAFRRWRAGAAA